jgi:NitT/TauT family transport system ATP-binding protein
MQELLYDIWNKFHSTVIFVTHDIREAVFLGDEIHILKSQPSKFVENIHVDLPLQRNKSTKREPRYEELVREVEDAMLRVADMK